MLEHQSLPFHIRCEGCSKGISRRAEKKSSAPTDLKVIVDKQKFNENGGNIYSEGRKN